MKTTYFKVYGQKSPNNKIILVSVMDADVFENGDFPDQFTAQGIMMPKTIYTGTYPTIKINTDTIEDRSEDLKGQGIQGVIMNEGWYSSTRKENDSMGVSLE